MKKTLRLSAITTSVLATSLLLASTASFAANYKGEGNYKDVPCPVVEQLLGGFYLGGQIGYESYRVRENFNLAGDFTANPAINASGWVGGLFAGYGQYFNDFYYLGGEIVGNYSGASTSSTIYDVEDGDSLTGSFNAYGSWGLALLPGLKLNNASLLYLRLGYNWARLKATGSFVDNDAAITSGSASTSNWQGGFAYGLGLESLITGNWSVRTEFTHTNYNSFSSSVAQSSVSFNPSDNQFMVGLLYHFG